MKHARISIIPLDTYSIISNKKVSHEKCPVCGKEHFEGAEIVYGPSKRHFAICNSCLYRLDKTILPSAREAKVSYKNRNITITKSISKQKCHCDDINDIDYGYRMDFNGIMFKCCQDCYDYLYDEIHKYNIIDNPLYINQEQYAKERETSILLAQQEIYEGKLIKEAKTVASKLRSPYLIDYYYSLKEDEKSEFLEQYQAANRYSDIKAVVHKCKIKEPDFIDSLVLTKAFPHINCSIKHAENDEHKAKFYLKSSDIRMKTFRFTVCQDDLIALLSCLRKILQDVLLKTATEDGVEITRQEGDEMHKCYSCETLNDVFVISWGNACFVLCEKCAEKFYEKVTELLSEQDKSYVPKSINKIEYRNYDERKMKCYKNSNSVNIIGYPLKRAVKNNAEFCIHTKIHPTVHCEKLEHNYIVPAKTIITTQRNDDDFCLVLCPTCATHLETALQHSNYDMFTGYGTSIFVQKRRWLNGEHCVFCGTRDGDCNRVRLGSVEFNCCNDCKTKLKNVVAKCKRPIKVNE